MYRLFIIIFLYSLSVSSQHLDFLYYQIAQEEGLPDREVYSIIEDRSGLIWLATNSGLYSYDGKKFVLYKHPEQRKTAVFSPQIDAKGRLWFCNLNGQFFYIENKEITLFGDFRNLTKDVVVNFSIIDNFLFISTNQSIVRVHIATKEKKEFLYKERRPGISKVIKIEQDYFITDGEKLHLINELSNITFSKKKGIIGSTKAEKCGDKIITHFYSGNTNEFFLFQEEKEIVLNGVEKVKDLSILNIEYRGNRVWILTSDGAFEYIMQHNKLCFQNKYLRGYSVSSLLIDSKNNIWFSTLSSGVFVIPDTRIKKINRIHTTNSITNFKAINDSIIFYVEGRKFFTKNNLNKANLYSEEVKRLHTQNMFYDAYLNRFYFFNGIEAFIYDKNKLLPYSKADNWGSKNVIRINENTVWVSFYNKLLAYNTKTFEKVSFIKGRCNKLLLNKESEYAYVDFYQGLKAGKNIQDLNFVLYNKQRIFGRALTEQPKSEFVWVAFENKVLCLKGTTVINTIIIDKKYTVLSLSSDINKLWIGTNKGILRYNYTNKKLSVLNRFNQVFKPNIKQIETTENYTYAVTDSDIFRFSNTYTNYNVLPDKPYFKVTKEKKRSYKKSEVFEIESNDKSIDVEFMINGFKSLENHQLEYRIDQNHWRKIKNNNLTLSSLSYGNTELQVRALNFKGEVSEVNSLPIFVHKPFYLQWWFITLLVIAIIIAIVFFVKFLLKKQEEKKDKEMYQIEIKRQITNLKLENLRSQMNPHFIFNALNSIQEYIYSNDKKQASSYLVKFSRLIRMYLDHSRVSEITLQKEIDALFLYLALENSRMGGKLTYKIEVENSLKTNAILVPSLFIQPYIENAIKHGLLHKRGEKKLSINFYQSKTNLYCEVTDNGIGRESSRNMKRGKMHSSFSTKANTDRVKLMNIEKMIEMRVEVQDLKNKNNEAIGTKVQIVLPVKKI
ncbi:hypothetical protein EI424_11420 [Tenacibaculum singaporense]|nr:hypothetical protein EI424_11420 [Tenacibaculum singaporense]